MLCAVLSVTLALSVMLEGKPSSRSARTRVAACTRTRSSCAICLGLSNLVRPSHARSPRSLHRSPFLARHAVYLIAIAAYHWHGVLLSFRTCYLSCPGRHPVAFPVGWRAEVRVCSSRWRIHGPRGNGHSAGSSKRHAKTKTPMIISSSVRIFWCQWHHPTMPVTPAATLARGGRFLDSMSRTHSRHRYLIVYVYGV